MLQRHLITIWSVLALIAAVAGAASTLALGHLWLRQWVRSGEKFPIGEWCRIHVPAGAIDSLVYYESDHSVGRHAMSMYMRDPRGQRATLAIPDDDNEFAVSTRQGRALFRLALAEPGLYEFRCSNPNYASDAEVPASDRVVFLKTPNTRAGALAVRRAILATGGTVTIMAVMALYIAHLVALSKRDRGAGASSGPVEAQRRRDSPRRQED